MVSNGFKKRKRGHDLPSNSNIDTSKPTAVFRPAKGRQYTLSIALPGSIIANAQTHDQKTALAGQIARALAVFCVDEIVVFEDESPNQKNGHDNPGATPGEHEYTANSNPSYFLMHLLAYLEAPPHLRKYLFPLHPDLRTAGTLPSLDMPHHLRAHEWCQYREGVTIETPQVNGDDSKKKKKKNPDSSNHPTTLVEAGLPYPVKIPAHIPVNTRVTLKFPSHETPSQLSTSSLAAEAVAPATPREETGYYWGYAVRPSSSLSNVFTECPYDGGYDLTMGTSERGVALSSLISPPSSAKGEEPSSMIPRFRHMLLCFGGVAGLEAAVKADDELEGMGVTDPKALFDYWINLVPAQGSRTIRTEEAVWLGLMGLRDLVLDNGIR